MTNEWFGSTRQRCNYREDLKRAKDLGYGSLTECIRGLYREYGSIRVAAEMINKMSPSAFRSHLVGMGEPIKPNGGSNFQNNDWRTDTCGIRGCDTEFTTQDPRIKHCPPCGSRQARSRRNNQKRKNLGDNVVTHRGAVSEWAIL